MVIDSHTLVNNLVANYQPQEVVISGQGVENSRILLKDIHFPCRVALGIKDISIQEREIAQQDLQGWS